MLTLLGLAVGVALALNRSDKRSQPVTIASDGPILIVASDGEYGRCLDVRNGTDVSSMCDRTTFPLDSAAYQLGGRYIVTALSAPEVAVLRVTDANGRSLDVPTVKVPGWRDRAFGYISEARITSLVALDSSGKPLADPIAIVDLPQPPPHPQQPPPGPPSAPGG